MTTAHETDILAIINDSGRDRRRYVTDSTGTIVREVYDMDGVMVSDGNGTAMAYEDYRRTKARAEAVLAAKRAAQAREEQERIERMRAEAKRKAAQARAEAEERERRRVEEMRAEAKRKAAQARADAEERQRAHERAVRQMRIEELLRQCDEEHERIMELVQANDSGHAVSVPVPIAVDTDTHHGHASTQGFHDGSQVAYAGDHQDLEDFAQAYVASKSRDGR